MATSLEVRHHLPLFAQTLDPSSIPLIERSGRSVQSARVGRFSASSIWVIYITRCEDGLADATAAGREESLGFFWHAVRIEDDWSLLMGRALVWVASECAYMVLAVLIGLAGAVAQRALFSMDVR